MGDYTMKARLLAAAMGAATVLGGGNAFAADLGGNCCADLEERIAELEAERQQVMDALKRRAERDRHHAANRAKVAAIADQLRQQATDDDR